eukprot:1603406-Heterocapsa_arctica.AAC.1
MAPVGAAGSRFDIPGALRFPSEPAEGHKRILKRPRFLGANLERFVKQGLVARLPDAFPVVVF